MTTFAIHADEKGTQPPKNNQKTEVLSARNVRSDKGEDVLKYMADNGYVNVKTYSYPVLGKDSLNIDLSSEPDETGVVSFFSTFVPFDKLSEEARKKYEGGLLSDADIVELFSLSSPYTYVRELDYTNSLYP